MTWFTESLRCPITGELLEVVGEELVVVSSASERYAYPISDGVPILLKDHARSLA